jgi:hypothetical protein
VPLKDTRRLLGRPVGTGEGSVLLVRSGEPFVARFITLGDVPRLEIAKMEQVIAEPAEHVFGMHGHEVFGLISRAAGEGRSAQT